MILDNPLTTKSRQIDRAKAASLFSLPPNIADGQYLILRCYTSSRPECFFNRSVQAAFTEWLENCHQQETQLLHDYLRDHLAEIDRALLFLHEINVEDWHDKKFDSSKDWELLKFIDQSIHRTYLRLIEGVLKPFARLPAHFSRLTRGAGTEGLDIYAISEELTNGPLEEITSSYRHTIRNGIGHGGIIYGQFEITYRDKRGNEEALDTNEIIKLCDDLLDSCNGMAAALTVFYVRHRGDGYPIPEELLLQELREETATPWWAIDGTIRSRVSAGDQIIIYARTHSADFPTIQFSATQTGILAEAFAPGYERYFVSIRGGSSDTGWAAFHGERLRDHRVAGDDLVKYTDVIESIAFFPFKNRPQWMRRIWNMYQAVRIGWPYARRDWYAARGIPEIIPRDATVHRNSWRSVLNGSVVMPLLSPLHVRKFRRKIIDAALRIAEANSAMARHLPLGFAQVSVFCRDYRTRRLVGYGLGPDLVCTVRYQTISRIRNPDIMGSTVEVAGAWRLAWNRAWLEREGVTLDTPLPWRVLRS
jgi:hypothetical protein